MKNHLTITQSTNIRVFTFNLTTRLLTKKRVQLKTLKLFSDTFLREFK